MPVFTRPDAEINYEVHGSGFPLLLFAPGGLRSQLEYWRHSPSAPDAPPPWMNPMVDLAGRFTVIGMDQRNAGASRGAVTATHGWHTYASPGTYKVTIKVKNEGSGKSAKHKLKIQVS